MYVRKGHIFRCGNGHAMCEAVDDIWHGELSWAQKLGQWRTFSEPKVGDAWPTCSQCGAVLVLWEQDRRSPRFKAMDSLVAEIKAGFIKPNTLWRHRATELMGKLAVESDWEYLADRGVSIGKKGKLSFTGTSRHLRNRSGKWQRIWW